VWTPDSEYHAGKGASYQLVSDIYQIQAERSLLEQDGGDVRGGDKPQPQPESGLNSCQRVGGFCVLNKVGQDVNQNQRGHERGDQFLRMALSLHLLELLWRPRNNLKKLVAEEQRGIPESSKDEVDECRHDHRGVFDLHEFFSFRGC